MCFTAPNFAMVSLLICVVSDGGVAGPLSGRQEIAKYGKGQSKGVGEITMLDLVAPGGGSENCDEKSSLGYASQYRRSIPELPPAESADIPDSLEEIFADLDKIRDLFDTAEEMKKKNGG